MAGQLTRAQVNKILEHFEDIDFVPFVGIAAALSNISPDLAEAAYQNGRNGRGTAIENDFHQKVNYAQASFAKRALAYINDPYLSKEREPKARQLMNLLVKLLPATFGGRQVKVPTKDPKLGKRSEVLTKTDVEQAIKGLEDPE